MKAETSEHHRMHLHQYLLSCVCTISQAVKRQELMDAALAVEPTPGGGGAAQGGNADATVSAPEGDSTWWIILAGTVVGLALAVVVGSLLVNRHQQRRHLHDDSLPQQRWWHMGTQRREDQVCGGVHKSDCQNRSRRGEGI